MAVALFLLEHFISMSMIDSFGICIFACGLAFFFDLALELLRGSGCKLVVALLDDFEMREAKSSLWLILACILTFILPLNEGVSVDVLGLLEMFYYGLLLADCLFVFMLVVLVIFLNYYSEMV